jgi:hypothetical protein
MQLNPQAHYLQSFNFLLNFCVKIREAQKRADPVPQH